MGTHAGVDATAARAATEAVPGIPRTRTGKLLEVPVRRMLSGIRPEAAANRSALADPAVLDALLTVAADELSDAISVPRPDPEPRQEPT